MLALVLYSVSLSPEDLAELDRATAEADSLRAVRRRASDSVRAHEREARQAAAAEGRLQDSIARAARNAPPVTVEGFVLCPTRDQMQQFMRALGTDPRAITFLLESGCASVPGGIPLSVLDIEGGYVRVRIYGAEGKTAEAWTIPGAVSTLAR